MPAATTLPPQTESTDSKFRRMLSNPVSIIWRCEYNMVFLNNIVGISSSDHNSSENITSLGLEYEASVNQFEIPSKNVLFISNKVRSFLLENNIELTDQAPLSEGGVVFTYRIGNRRFNIQIENDGSTVFIIKQDDLPTSIFEVPNDEVLDQVKYNF